MHRITLRYTPDGPQELSTQESRVELSEERVLWYEHCEGRTLLEALERLAEQVRQHKVDAPAEPFQVVMSRKTLVSRDADAGVPRQAYRDIVLQEEQVELLLRSPAEFLEQVMTVRVMYAPESSRRAPPPVRDIPLRTGTEMLAQAFGEEVYLRLRGSSSMVECCITGRWIRLDSAPYPVRVDGEWAVVRVDQLLQGSTADRFWIPREWVVARGSPWVSRGDLVKLLEELRGTEHK